MNYKGLVMTKQDNEIAEKRRKESYLKYNHSEKGRATRKKWVESNQERLKKSSEKYAKTEKGRQASRRAYDRLALMTRRQYGYRLKQLRMARGVSQSEAAKMTGIAVRTIQNLECGRSYSGTEALQRYLFGLGYGNEEIMDIHCLKYPVAKMRQLVLTELSEQELNSLEESELYQIVMSCIKKLN